MESIIDIQLVKEQLRLLGHDVADDVILEFVKGLNTRTVDQQAPKPMETKLAASGLDDGFPDTTTAAAGNLSDAQPLNSKAPPRQQATVPTQVQSSSVWRPQHDTDAAPSQIRQAPDQQSPKRLPAADAESQDQTSPAATDMQQRTALDKRCRTFLARCSDKPSPQSEQQRPMLLQMPQLHDRALVGGNSSSQLSAAESSELVLGYAGHDSDSDAEDGFSQRDHSSKHVLSCVQPHQLQAAGSWVLRQSQQQQQSQQHSQSHIVADLPGAQEMLGSDSDSSHVSDSDGDDGMGLEAEGSKFLLHQAATKQRVRARLAAKMAGYTAAAAASSSKIAMQEQQKQQDASLSTEDGDATASRSQHGTASSGSSGDAHSSSSSTAAAADSSSDLPRFGFRPGYKPVGIHMPPPPSAAAVQALTAARALRQQATGSAAAGVDRAAAVHNLTLDLHHLDVAGAQQSRQQQQQQVPLHGAPRADPSFVPAVGMGVGCGSLHLVASPGKAACTTALGGARSSGSIIGGETPPCLAAAGSKPRQSPSVDPLYMAPLSPRRSNPATPRSSPAMSPAALAPLPAAALSVIRSPAGVAPSSATASVTAARSIRQGLSFSAGSRGAPPHADLQRQQQQQQKLASVVGRRASSAPSPASAAPRGAGRVPSVCGNSSNGTSSRPGSSRSSQGVSHQSLYCQKLAYSSVRGTVAPGVRKTDRVARFQELQQQWSRDRFLCSGAGGAAAKMSNGGQHS